jgi:hypothetical protein
MRLLPTHEMPASRPVVNLRTGDALTMAVPAWGRPAAWKGMLNCRPVGDEKAKNKAAFGCQFSYQLARGAAKKVSNSAPVHSVRDRGVGGSNPLAPTNFLRKPAESRLPGHSVPRSASSVGTECSVLQIRPSSRIVRDFSPPSLATGLSRPLLQAKCYPPRYPTARSATDSRS